MESLRHGAAQTEDVIHAGFIHDFTRFREVCEVDKLAIQKPNALYYNAEAFILNSFLKTLEK